MFARLMLPIFVFFSILAQAALSRAEVVSGEKNDHHFIQILQADSLLLNGQLQTVYQIRMCEVANREVCGLLGSRAYSAAEIERARIALVKEGWLGVGAGAALIAGGALLGAWAGPAAYLAANKVIMEGGIIMIPLMKIVGLAVGTGVGGIAAEVYLNPSSRFKAAEVLSVKAVRGEQVSVSAKISDMGFLIDKTFRSLDASEFTLPAGKNLRQN